jgi:hypothetical protein
MRVVTDQIGRQVAAGRRVMDRTFHVVEIQVRPAMSTRRVQVASGMMLGAIVALGIGVLVYRRRRRSTLASRLQSVLPEELVERAGAIKKRAFG